MGTVTKEGIFRIAADGDYRIEEFDFAGYVHIMEAQRDMEDRILLAAQKIREARAATGVIERAEPAAYKNIPKLATVSPWSHSPCDLKVTHNVFVKDEADTQEPTP
jgi:hypothetical protein